MMQRLLCTALLAGIACLAQAQTTTAPAMAAAPAATSSPAKHELAKRWVAVQDPALENLARNVVELPARQLLAAAEPVLRGKVPADKREAVAKQLQDAARKYVDETTPAVRKRAQELGQSDLQASIEEKYTEDELRQIVAFFESATFKKMQQTQPQIDQALQRKLVSEMQPTIEGKARALQVSMTKILGVAPPPAAASAGPASGNAGKAAKPAAPAASKP
jgi:uncharacterized protein